jgi:hypothetical protein
VGIFYGLRTVNNSEIRKVYGNGTVSTPYLAVKVWKGITLGVDYEGGYSKEGKIGLYQESSKLQLTGFDFFAGYEWQVGRISPYLKIGYGSFSYKQEIESLSVREFKVDHKKGALAVAGGIKFYALKKGFLAGEVKYVPLKVRPFEEKVDLGGFRLLIGAGYTI